MGQLLHAFVNATEYSTHARRTNSTIRKLSSLPRRYRFAVVSTPQVRESLSTAFAAAHEHRTPVQMPSDDGHSSRGKSPFTGRRPT
jgi:hypothetical protein